MRLDVFPGHSIQFLTEHNRGYWGNEVAKVGGGLVHGVKIANTSKQTHVSTGGVESLREAYQVGYRKSRGWS